MSEDFFRPVAGTESRKLRGRSKTDSATVPGVRIYCTRVASEYLLQVRGPLLRSDGSVGGDFVIAGSRLSLDDLRALRDACSRLISEAESLSEAAP